MTHHQQTGRRRAWYSRPERRLPEPLPPTLARRAVSARAEPGSNHRRVHAPRAAQCTAHDHARRSGWVLADCSMTPHKQLVSAASSGYHRRGCLRVPPMVAGAHGRALRRSSGPDVAALLCPRRRSVHAGPTGPRRPPKTRHRYVSQVLPFMGQIQGTNYQLAVTRTRTILASILHGRRDPGSSGKTAPTPCAEPPRRERRHASSSKTM
jgi:hypothetical protein